MPLYHLILIALIQGVTEFIPVSSSGHLILLPALSGLKDQGTFIDISAHVGTLLAVIIFFRSDVQLVFKGIAQLAKGETKTLGARLFLCLLVATIPVVVLGLVLKISGLADALRSVLVIGWTMLLFGLLLYWADQRAVKSRAVETLTWADAARLGLWQAIALIPGVSRSGITITGALWAGFTRKDATRFSMLMSIPTILASGILSSLDLIIEEIPIKEAAIVSGFSFLAALAAMTLMWRLLNSISFTPYVIYRIILGLILIGLGYTGTLSL